MVKEVVSQTEINDANLKEVKMNLLPVEYYNYSIKVSDGSNVPYDTLRMFKYEALEAERDDFSKTKNQLGSKFLVDLLKDRLSDQDKLKIEKEYSHFFEALKEISDINDIINWQETSELKGAKKFFSHINILPNMPPMQSILSSVRLGYSEEELSMQGLGYRNLVLLFVLINSLLGKETDIALDVLTIEEPEAHLCINNTRSVPKCLVEHNHHELEKEIEKYTTEQLSKNGRSLLGVFSNYYNNYRYANYIPGKNSSELRKLFISFLKKQNGKFNFDEPCALIQFDAFKRFYINELGKLARYYFELIEHKARDINTYTYEIDSYSNAARVFLSTQRRSFYEQMVIEQNSIKELLLYMYKNKRESGAFRLLNDMESLEMDDALVNDYLADLCEGKVNNWLIDYVDELYEEMEDIKKRKERKELLALIGNRSVLFDFDDFEDDENESYHRNMFESDDIEGGENL